MSSIAVKFGPKLDYLKYKDVQSCLYSLPIGIEFLFEFQCRGACQSSHAFRNTLHHRWRNLIRLFPVHVLKHSRSELHLPAPRVDVPTAANVPPQSPVNPHYTIKYLRLLHSIQYCSANAHQFGKYFHLPFWLWSHKPNHYFISSLPIRFGFVRLATAHNTILLSCIWKLCFQSFFFLSIQPLAQR